MIFRRSLACTVLAASAILAPASPQATTYLVEFKAEGGWFGTQTQPYGLPPNPILFGSVLLDNTKIGGDAIIGFDWVTGTRTWTVADVNRAPSQVQFLGGPPIGFAIWLDSFNSLLGSNNTAELYDGHSEIACNGCVTVLRTTAVPEPSQWALLISGLFGVGISLRRVRSRSVGRTA